MGVLGLSPFLRKKCPEVIKSLNERFHELKGSRIVIDGTLITQRLHFAPSPNPYRHVIGWYRLINELQASEITAICIFDGKERTAAKRREIERRQEALRVINARGNLERDRLQRLQKLSTTIATRIITEGQASHTPLSEASDEERQKMLTSLHSILLQNQQNTPPIPSTYVSQDTFFGGNPEDVISSLKYHRRLATEESYGGFEENDISEVLEEDNSVCISPLRKTQEEEIVGTEQLPEDSTISSAATSLSDEFPEEPFMDNKTIADTTSFTVKPDSIELTSSFNDELASLRVEFQHSLMQLKSLPARIPPTSHNEEDVDARVDLNMSKTQFQLTEEEGEFWGKLSEMSLKDDDLATAEQLVQKSSVLWESYERRRNVPTSITYEESKEIIRAMGIPCIEASGPYEAEAVASSLVLKGYADFVASEDTDILVYGAPIVRNVTGRDFPLTVISGSDIPPALGLTQQQFVDFCILLGTDFSKRIKNVGPARALKFIQGYGTIEDILKNEPQYPPHDIHAVYLEQVEQARSVFRTLPPVPAAELLACQEVDENKVNTVLQKYGLSSQTSTWDHATALAGNYFSDNPFAI